MTDPLVIIPARLESTRLPAKMLRRLGARSLIEWTWRAAAQSGFPCLIATDSDAIAREGRRFGARVVVTGRAHNGTERCALALAQISDKPRLVINWQGDSPLTPPWVAQALARAFDDPIMVATPIRRVAAPGPLSGGQVSAAVAPDGRALYFSRAAIPPTGPWWVHVGLYAYRADALARYGQAELALERAERLEQLRWLELGIPVHCVPIEVGELPEVNEPRDLVAVGLELGACATAPLNT